MTRWACPIVLGFGALLLTGCTPYWIAAGTATAVEVGSEATTDKSSLDHLSEFFGSRCEHLSLYDQPPRCRARKK